MADRTRCVSYFDPQRVTPTILTAAPPPLVSSRGVASQPAEVTQGGGLTFLQDVFVSMVERGTDGGGGGGGGKDSCRGAMDVWLAGWCTHMFIFAGLG
ncbi:hypothetical protein E2C01_016488 [Portunus trituberculatus]|uniref:Uncharacterized protein n=1 Tax=Portunus trituberculatus TaxID=210409 RepID=A0A5B7DQU7_PORTR|nr:hypothetical protein [Portunus trituberculatus]